MNQTRLWTVAGIIATVVIVGFVLSVPRVRELPRPTTHESSVATSVPVVTLRDTYKKGVHTLTGSVMAPNACTTVTAEASVEGDASVSQGILLALTLPPDSGICLEVPTSIKFSTTVNAPSGLAVKVTVNGVTASSSAP